MSEFTGSKIWAMGGVAKSGRYDVLPEKPCIRYEELAGALS